MMDNHYLRLGLYSLLASILILILGGVISFLEFSNSYLLSKNIKLVFIFIPLIIFPIIIFGNIFLLNKINFKNETDQSLLYKSCFSYTFMYFVLTVIISSFLYLILPHKLGLGYDNMHVLGFTSAKLVLYFLIFPYAYLRYREKLIRIKWF